MVESIRNVSHLGSYPVLLLLVIFVMAYLYLDKSYQKAMVVITFVMVSTFLLEAIRRTISTNGDHCTENNILPMTIYLILAQTMNIGHRRFLITYALVLSVLIGLAKLYIDSQSLVEILLGWFIGLFIGYLYSCTNNYLEQHSTDGESRLPKLDDRLIQSNI